MITVKQIEAAAKYLGRHLSANDYYAEGETFTGYWRGNGAKMLGLEGDVRPEQFELIRQCRHPENGEKLRPRVSKIEFHDIVLSAPKSFSIAAVVGGDERLREAFRESTDATLKELERYAEVRDRKGSNNQSENTIRTGNVVVAVFQHDSSRLLDPQCHAHLVHGNLSFCEERGEWLALQPKAMLEATEVVEFFRKDLAARIENLGYEVRWRQDGSFGIKGIALAVEEKFSTRTKQRRAFEERYERLFGQAPSKQRIADFIRESRGQATNRFRDEYLAKFGKDPDMEMIESFVKDWRSSKLVQISTSEVRRRQRARLSAKEAASLDALIENAKQTAAQDHRIAERAAEDVATAGVGLARRQRQGVGIKTLITKATDVLGDATEKLDALAERAKHEAEERQRAVQKRRKREADHRRRVRISRTEVLRRMKFGMRVQQAVRGYPGAIISANTRRIRR